MSSLPPQPSAREVAFHEAGHIFAGKRMGKYFVSAEIHPHRVTGRASTTWASQVTSTFVEGVTAAAGVCAEALCKGQPAPRAFPLTIYGTVSDDEELARKSARGQANSPGETKTEDELVEHYLAFAETTCTAEGHWKVIEDLAEHLEKNQEIDDAIATDILKRHGF